MLHGCKQDPDDFARGTNMNSVAEAHGLAVVYPAQSPHFNQASCWNWFNPADQERDAGEPSIITGITRALQSEFAIGHGRMFVAGLSAGGAMAAVIGQTYPDVYAAVGIHSGLAYRSANDVVSAFAAMRGSVVQGGGGTSDLQTKPTPSVRTILLHGSADQTVHPSNADRIFAVQRPREGVATEEQLMVGGRSCTRSVVRDRGGIPIMEYWIIDGAGHAWSGGCSDGSYADAKGPNASREMVRFFLERETESSTGARASSVACATSDTNLPPPR
jgi:poly(hydroxyalkanoate) depolymerase family esterase